MRTLTPVEIRDVVIADVGHNGAQVWELMNTLETTKRSGPKGTIIWTLDTLAEKTGLDLDTLVNVAVRLVQKGYARLCDNGMGLKAS